MSDRKRPAEFALSLFSLALTVLALSLFLVHERVCMAERAAFWFMRDHLRLGEHPAFILQVAGDGLPQPWEVLLSRREVWVATFLAALQAGALLWLAARQRA